MSVNEFEQGKFKGSMPLHRLITRVTKTECEFLLPKLLEAVTVLEANNGLGRVGFECERCHKYGDVCRQQSSNGFRLVANIKGPNCVESRTRQ